MENYSKLKWTAGWYIPIIIFLFLFAAIFEATQTGKSGYTVWIFGTFFILLGLYDYYRTRLVTFLIIGLLFGSGTWHSLMAFNHIWPFSFAPYITQLVAVVFFFIFTWPIIRNQVRLGKNARQIFLLASENVHQSAKGFTSRPYSAGQTTYSREEIQGFARFMNGKQIAKVITQQDNIILTFSMGISPLANPDLQKISYVSFSSESQISVHVSQYDYRRYREELTFDQICEALAELFKRFLNYYREGKESRILVELNG
jgi:hypothetical protein